MEKRTITLTLEKAKEFYNSGNEALKAVALQAFTVAELKALDYRSITTFEDACKALNMRRCSVQYDIERLTGLEGELDNHLQAIYKIDIIRRALNGDWKPDMKKGKIYYPWVKFYHPDIKNLRGEHIATLKINGQEYLLHGGFTSCSSLEGLSEFSSSCEMGFSNPKVGLLACKSEEIARHMSKYFGKLIFDACYAQHIDTYKWVED